MRLQHLEQIAGGLSADDPARVAAKAVIVAEVERLHWRIWNGKAKNARISIDRIRAVMHHFQGDPPAWPLAQRGSRGIRPPRMGRLVQQSSLARTDRKYPARRGRSTLLCPSRRARHGGVTQTKQPPANPAR